MDEADLFGQRFIWYIRAIPNVIHTFHEPPNLVRADVPLYERNLRKNVASADKKFHKIVATCTEEMSPEEYFTSDHGELLALGRKMRARYIKSLSLLWRDADDYHHDYKKPVENIDKNAPNNLEDEVPCIYRP